MGAKKSKATKEKFTIAVDKEVLEQFRDNCKRNALSQSGKIEQLMISFNKSMTPQAKESKQVANIVRKIGQLLDKKLSTLSMPSQTIQAQPRQRIPRIQELQARKNEASIPKHAMQRQKVSQSVDKENQFQQRIASGHVPSISELTDLAHYRRQKRGF